MASLIDYKGLQVVSPDPVGAGGLAIQDDLKQLVDWNPKSRWDATTDPASNDDEGNDFHPGSMWLNTGVTPARLFVCKNAATGAAEWEQIAAAEDAVLYRVKVASTANGHALLAGDTVDGILLAAGDRVLVKDNSPSTTNGIYVVAASGGPSRADDYTAGDAVAGTLIVVEQGTVGGDSLWLCTSDSGSDIVGTGSLTYQSLASKVTSLFTGLTPAGDRLIYFNGTASAALTELTGFARTLLDDADAAAARTTLGLEIGTDVQGYDNTLNALAAYNTNGLLAQTGADTFAGRTITAGTGVSVSNGNGVSGNPTIGIGQAVDQTASVRFGKLSVATYFDTRHTVRIVGQTTFNVDFHSIGIANNAGFSTATSNANAHFLYWGRPAMPGSGTTLPMCAIYYVPSMLALTGSDTITSYYGVCIENQSQATNNIGVASLLSAGTNKWNFYATGTANNLSNGAWIFGQTTAPTPGNNQAAVYAKDVSGTAEICVKDEAGTETQISPHPAEVMDAHPELMKRLGLPEVSVPWGYQSEQTILGKRVTVDMAATIRCIEFLMAEAGRPVQLIREEEVTPTTSWETVQQIAQKAHHDKQQEFDRLVEMRQQELMEEEQKPLDQRKEIPPVQGERPGEFQPKTMPGWIAKRLRAGQTAKS